MAVMTTVLTPFDNNGTFTAPSHTVAKPSLVKQKRKVASSASAVSESSIKVVQATEDAAGDPLPSKITFETIVRYSGDALAADLSAAVALHAEIVNSDEFANMVATQEYVA